MSSSGHSIKSGVEYTACDGENTIKAELCHAKLRYNTNGKTLTTRRVRMMENIYHLLKCKSFRISTSSSKTINGITCYMLKDSTTGLELSCNYDLDEVYIVYNHHNKDGEPCIHYFDKNMWDKY